MMLDDFEKIFLVQVGTRGKKQKPIYVQFRFKPSYQMELLLNDYNIEYQMSEERFSGVSLVHSGRTSVTSYRIPIIHKNITPMKYHYFYFTSNIIEKVFDYYKVNYEKGVKYND